MQLNVFFLIKFFFSNRLKHFFLKKKKFFEEEKKREHKKKSVQLFLKEPSLFGLKKKTHTHTYLHHGTVAKCRTAILGDTSTDHASASSIVGWQKRCVKAEFENHYVQDTKR